jgi:hypothetical protein
LASKWDVKNWSEAYPNFLDCDYIEVEVLTAKRLSAAIKRRTARKAKPKKRS